MFKLEPHLVCNLHHVGFPLGGRQGLAVQDMEQFFTHARLKNVKRKHPQQKGALEVWVVENSRPL